MANWSIPQDARAFRFVTLLTVARIPVGIALAVLLHVVPLDRYEVTALFIVLLTFIEVSDGLDGHYARKLNVQSEWGAMLDPYSDSVTRLIVYFGLATTGLVYAFVPLAMAFRDVTVAYCRILMTRSGGSVAAKLSGKIKAVVQGVGAYAAILAVYLPAKAHQSAALAVSIVVTAVTLWSIGQYAQGALATMKSAGEADG